MTVDSLDTLLHELNAGDPAAAERAFLEFEPYLRKVVRRNLPCSLRSKFDSVDVVQSIYGDLLGAFRRGGLRFGTVAQLRAFLVTATRNRFIDRLRQNRTAVRRERPLVDADATAQPQSALPRPSQTFAAGELWDRLVALCPPEHHELLARRRRGESVGDIAAALGLHEGSVRRVLRTLSARLACRQQSPTGSASQ